MNNDLLIKLQDFEQISREVGYCNVKSNIKEINSDGDEVYNQEDISIFNSLRKKQLEQLNELKRIIEQKENELNDFLSNQEHCKLLWDASHNLLHAIEAEDRKKFIKYVNGLKILLNYPEGEF